MTSTSNNLDRLIDEQKELMSHLSTVTYYLGGLPEGTHGKFNHLADESLFGKEIDKALQREIRSMITNNLVSLKKSVNLISNNRRGKSKDLLKVPVKNNRFNEPIFLTDQFYDFIFKSGVNLGIANLDKFVNLDDAHSFSQMPGSNVTAMKALLDTDPQMLQNIADSGIVAPDSICAGDFDLKKVLAPIKNTHACRRFSISMLLSFIEKANQLADKTGKRVKPSSAMDEFFGPGTNMKWTINGVEYGSEFAAADHVAAAHEVESLNAQITAIKNHKDRHDAALKPALQEQLVSLKAERETANDALKVAVKAGLGWTSAEPSKLVLKLSRQHKSLWEILSDIPERKDGAAFVPKDKAVDGVYGYNNKSRMTLLNYFSIPAEVVKHTNPELYATAMTAQHSDDLTVIDNRLRTLSEAWRTLAKKN